MTTATLTEVALVDLSSIAHPLWHMSGSQPDPDWTSNEIVNRVRSLTANHGKAAICCDSGVSFRKEIDPTYKANRPEREATLHHQIALAKERLAADGYPVWSVKGFEADDLIASAARAVLEVPDTSVLVITGDKDLMQLVAPRVRLLRIAPNTEPAPPFDEAAVEAKYGVKPSQMRDYLSLVGDASDNVKGAKGIGEKTAAVLLAKFGTLEGCYAHINNITKPSIVNSLTEFRDRMQTVRDLITLRDDVALPLAELDADRASKAPPIEEQPEEMMSAAEEEPPHPPPTPPTPTGTPDPPERPVPPKPTPRPESTALAVQGEVVDYKTQLEPRSMQQAIQLANYMFAARLFPGYGTAQAVLATMLAGRELGIQSIASLRAFHVVDGKHALDATFIRALVMRSGLAEYFTITERTVTSATFETLRKGDPRPVSLTYTMEDAQRAGLAKSGSGYAKNPADQFVARAGSKLARLVYPEVSFGLYAPEEFE